MLTTPCWAQDTVVLSSSSGSAGTTRLTGRVQDWNRETIQIETMPGRVVDYPAKRVRSVETQRSSEHERAITQEAARDFAAAAQSYTAAMADESRPWVRQDLLAGRVRSLHNAGRMLETIEAFVDLIADEPLTRHLTVAPLDWIGEEPSPRLQTRLVELIAEGQPPAVRLVAASHLLSVAPLRTRAEIALGDLGEGPDADLAHLAADQLMRYQLATLSADRLAAWEASLEDVTPDLRSGRWFLLGRAWSMRNEPQRAALSWMRVPILHPTQRRLAVESLLSSAGSLESAGDLKQAAEIYREIVRDYADYPTAATAAQRQLAEISGR